MYIIEKIIKLLIQSKNKDKTPIANAFEDNAEIEDVLTCKHNFMPIDSTGRILACSKCGYLITKKRLDEEKNKNKNKKNKNKK
ncbi:hypothetical protein IJ182_05650 [bacterium]|nr:hypothetical protein [bacterium]